MSNFYVQRLCRCTFACMVMSVLLLQNVQGQTINQNPGLNLVGDITAWNPNPPAPGSPLLSAYDPGNAGGGVVVVTSGNPGVRRWRASYQSTNPTGTYAFLYTTYTWSNKWANVNVVLNTLQNYVKEGASNNQLPTVNGKWYTTLWQDLGWVNTNAVWMETTNAPVTIASVTPSPGSVTPADPWDVTVTTSGSLSPEEKVYVRWTTNNYGASTVAQVSMAGNTGMITIPAQLDGTTIQYYAFTSTGTTVQIGSNYDMFSLDASANQTYNSVALPPVTITFQVDMASRGIETAGVHIAGSFNGNNYASTPLTLVSGTLYKADILLPQGATVQYKYSAADAAWAAETVPAGCDNGSGFREYVVGNSDYVVPPHCFGYCTTCPPSIPVTFRVNMTGLTVSGNGVHVAGEFGGAHQVWNPGGIQLLPVGGGMYETTLNIVQGKLLAYKYINGDSWGSEEGVPGACNVGGNRNLTVPVAPSYIIPSNCFGTCSNCVSVTFNVDMNGLTISGNGVHIAGDFQGWNPSNTALTHVGGGIYSVSVNVAPNSNSGFKFVNGNAWGTDESVPGLCQSGGNRSFTVANSNLSIPAVCFARCISCSATSNWTGGDGNFNNGNNWTAGVPPPATNGCAFNIQINSTGTQPTISGGTFSSGNVNIKPGATLTIASGATLGICGDLTGGGTFTGAGKVELTGTPAQNLTGTTNFSNLTLTKTSTTNVIGTAKIKGVLTLSNSTSNLVIPGGGKLVLVSDASATGSIAAIPSGATITGDVTQQRYLTGTGNGWFLAGTPIAGGDFSQWSDNMYMAVGSNLGGNQGVVGLGSQHTTIFKMDEPNAAIYVDTVQKYGWRAPVLGDLLSPGKGFRVWLKAYNTPSRVIDNVGTVTQGDFSFPNITRTEVANCQPNETPSTIIPCTEAFRGWNLLANPYPSSVDWDAVSPAWTKPAQMSNAWYRWHSAFGGYGVYPTGGPYAGTTPAPTNPNLIPTGQAFFVKVNTAGSYTVSIKESAKSNTGGQFLRVNANQDKIRVNLSQSTDPADYGYDAVIRFMADATDGFDAAYDFENLAANNFNLSVPVGLVGMSIASYAPLSGSKVIPLTTSYAGVYGNYFLKFTELENMLTTNTIYLRDNMLSSLEAVTPGYTYSYVANGTDALISNRFELVFSTESVTGNSLTLAGVHFGMHPNPVTGKSVNLTLSGVKDLTGQVSIVDVLGKQVYASKLNIKKDGLTEKSLDINLASGLYTVKLVTKTQTFTQKLIVR